jgi:hypothetical protein
MNNLKDFTQYVNEVKSEREIVRDLARRLSLDKDIIKYLNTSRAKRTMGWRELLQTKLHGNNLDYINYITKNMVADYNPQITGYIHINDDEDEFEETEETENGEEITKKDLKNSLDDIVDRVENIEDVLGIDPEDSDTVEVAKETLGLNTDDENEEEE